MSYFIKYAENSLDDYNKGFTYYHLISENLAQRFENQFWNCIKLIRDNPYSYQIRYSNIRIGIIENFPFTIHYFLEENIIYIQRILHNRRDY